MAQNEQGGHREIPQGLLETGFQRGTTLDELYERRNARPLGSGAYSSVYQARHRATGELVAIKRMLPEAENQEIPAHVIREVTLLRHLVHPNIVRLIDVQIHQGEFHLVFEDVENDLHRELKARRRNGQPVPIWQLASWSLDLLNGIHACHTRLILHRDLKPQNVLVSPDGLKICDFGISRMHQPMGNVRYSADVVTLWYRCPELLLGSPTYGPEVDIWSIGCIFAEMAVHRVLFPGDCEIGTVFMIFNLLGTPTEETWPGVTSLSHYKTSFPKWDDSNFADLVELRPELNPDGVDLMRGLLAMNPRARLSARKAKGHRCFDNFQGPAR